MTKAWIQKTLNKEEASQEEEALMQEIYSQCSLEEEEEVEEEEEEANLRGNMRTLHSIEDAPLMKISDQGDLLLDAISSLERITLLNLPDMKRDKEDSKDTVLLPNTQAALRVNPRLIRLEASMKRSWIVLTLLTKLH